MSDGKKKNTTQDQEVIFDEKISSKEEVEETHQECLSQIRELQEKLAETEGKYKRALADFQNLERHTQEAQKRFAKLATQGFVEELIHPYDHLLMAATHIKDKGLDMVVADFRHVFESEGLKEIYPKGHKFDAERMEAVDTKEGEENVVLEVLNCGYELNGIVIVPAKVIVGKSK